MQRNLERNKITPTHPNINKQKTTKKDLKNEQQTTKQQQQQQKEKRNQILNKIKEDVAKIWFIRKTNTDILGDSYKQQ